MKSRLVIHAGFAKCGSASIRTTLFHNFRKLQKENVFVFDKDLRIARTATDLIGPPIWSLERARHESENLAPRISKEIEAASRRSGNCLSILSAENLANPGMAELFAGLDDHLSTNVVFYLRPQLQWIPSAWKQWGLKTGVALSDFVSQCMKAHTPAFRQAIEMWKTALPAANIDVRFLIPELLTGGNPGQDFFNMLGLPGDAYQFENDARNPSLDVSILHALSKNPELFSDVHDNSLMLALTRTLSKKFRSTNIEMLSAEQEAKIEECFRDENLWLLQTYCGDSDAECIYRTHFMPREADARYSDMTDLELIYRCLGIVLESLAFSGGEVDQGKRKNQATGSLAIEEE